MADESNDPRISVRDAVRFSGRRAPGRAGTRAVLVVSVVLIVGLASLAVTILDSGDTGSNVETPMTYEDETTDGEERGDAAIEPVPQVRTPAVAPAHVVPGPAVTRTASPPAPTPDAEALELTEIPAEAEAPAALDPARDAAAAARLFARSQRALATGHTQLAIESARAAWARNPHDARIANHLAATYLDLGSTGNAETWSRRALALDPGLSRAWTNLGVALLAEGRLAEAYEAHGKAVDLDPDDWRALSGLAAVQRALGDLPGSAKSLAQAIARAPHRPELRYGLAVTHEKAGDLTAAREEFQRYLERSRGADPKREVAVRSWLAAHPMPATP